MQEIEKEFKKELSESIKLDKEGIVIKADRLGSLEALITLLRQENIKIIKAGIGQINKSDIAATKANSEINPLNTVLLGFNVSLDEEAELMRNEVKIILNEVIYKLIEDLKKWQEDKKKEIEREKLLGLAAICKLKIMHNFIFHNSNPAIFGVKVEAGKLKPGIELINKEGEKIARVKNIQQENKSVQEANLGMEIAISLPGTNFERQLNNEEFLYSDMGERQFRELKKNKDLLSREELSTLQEISQIKRKEKATWGI